jgi:hypothetical protein
MNAHGYTASAPASNDARKFLENVLVWPGSAQAPGWINVHVNAKNNDPTKNGGKPWVAGWPFKTVDEVLNRVSWVESTADFFNVWVCMSQQSDCEQKANGKLKAIRKAANATSLKAIWIDCDVKPGDAQHYHTMTEAMDALDAFGRKVGLPPPSMVINSGGGLHIYWTSDKPLTPDEWRPYAEGLKALLIAEGVKCDTGLTTDIARILRVPETLNHKYSPPRPVELQHFGQAYDFTKDLAFLKTVAPATVTATVTERSHAKRDVFVPAAEGGGGTFDAPDSAFAGLKPDDKLQAGVRTGPMFVDPRPIFGKDGCAWLREALDIGGKDFDQPQWNLSVLCTAFMENGNAIAHEISKGHTTYTLADTQALYDRKLADRERGVGYPSCKAIEGAGSEHCKACPHFAKGKSPLNIRAVTATVTDTHSSSSSFEQGPGAPPDVTVNYTPGNEVACRMALDNVVAADLSTFTSGEILTILRVPDQEKPGLERWGGDLPGTTPALPADIIERAERLTWMAPTGGKGERRWKRIKPPRDFCTDYIIQRRGRYAARPLLGIARVPFIRDDGTMRAESGYDPETGIFVDRSPTLVVPDFPTLDDANAALVRVMKPYQYYLFEDPVNGPLQVLAANLTALQRPYLKTAPMFAVNGVQAGTGKGQICRAIGHLALGTTAPFMSWGHDDEEFKKRFDTMLLASPAMLVMDNCNGRVLRGDTLEMILSEGEATIRQFNKLEAITVRSRTFLMANGNNIQISGDMSRRGIKINVLPRSASPESDIFPFTPEDYVTEHRDALLSDYYTIMRAYRHAGMPRSGLPAVGSFYEWERKVRDLIFWLTGHDLSGDFKKNKLDDPEQQEDAAVLSALRDLYQDQWFKASEVDAALKRAVEWRRPGMSVTPSPGPKATAAMKSNNSPTIDGLIQAVTNGTVTVGPDVLNEMRVYRKHVDQMKKEAVLLEAAEQKFGVKQDYAKTLGGWASGIQKKFIDGLILHRQMDPHTKIHALRVGLASSTAEE